MNRRQIIYSFAGAVMLTLLSICLFDQPIAAFVHRTGGRSSIILQQGTSFLEMISGFPIHKFALSYALLGAGLILYFWKPTRAAAWMLLFIGCAQFVTRITAGTLKGLFERLRPFEVIQAGDWDWKFFGGHGNSFPSGHGAHFWGLFFPLAFLFPRYRIPLLIIPLFISVARVGVNDPWCSDLFGSIAIAAAITLFFIWLFRVKPAQPAFNFPAPPLNVSENRNQKMNGSRTVQIITLATVLLTLNATGQKSDPPAPDYFPLHAGHSWTYRAVSGDTQHSVKVIKEEKQADGTIRYVVEKVAGARVLTVFSKANGWVLMHSEGYPEHEGLEIKYDTARQYLKDPLLAGAQWGWTGKDYTNTDLEEDSQVSGPEEVTVPAGKFAAMKVVTRVAGPGTLTRTSWYADGVGLVKSMTEAGQIKYGFELTDYSFKKQNLK